MLKKHLDSDGLIYLIETFQHEATRVFVGLDAEMPQFVEVWKRRVFSEAGREALQATRNRHYALLSMYTVDAPSLFPRFLNPRILGIDKGEGAEPVAIIMQEKRIPGKRQEGRVSESPYSNAVLVRACAFPCYYVEGEEKYRGITSDSFSPEIVGTRSAFFPTPWYILDAVAEAALAARRGKLREVKNECQNTVDLT